MIRNVYKLCKEFMEMNMLLKSRRFQNVTYIKKKLEITFPSIHLCINIMHEYLLKIFLLFLMIHSLRDNVNLLLSLVYQQA